MHATAFVASSRNARSEERVPPRLDPIGAKEEPGCPPKQSGTCCHRRVS
ncbi:hypothetical protein STRIP9103_08163 [Streptomyces ipomoeae 91-03]|uniref:Uncharacterized protein n=1 Tax=Streptomyces ipomoeae 91-03 TaxID=698759 RepID=L1KQA5_9ACTN|nr:hypothetical protein STRIP9103_08163 [Streptomyces ipomoeae 91-03]